MDEETLQPSSDRLVLFFFLQRATQMFAASAYKMPGAENYMFVSSANKSY